MQLLIRAVVQRGLNIHAPSSRKARPAPMIAHVLNNQPIVLVIDDDAAFGELIASIIESAGCHAIYASDGLLGLTVARQFSPALILCDFSMPYLDGGEVFRLLKSDAELQDVPRVLMSGHGCPDLREIPADAFIAKPIDTQSLRKLVRAFTRLREEAVAG